MLVMDARLIETQLKKVTDGSEFCTISQIIGVTGLSRDQIDRRFKNKVEGLDGCPKLYLIKHVAAAIVNYRIVRKPKKTNRGYSR